MAKTFPDSLAPRRLTRVMNTMSPRQRSTRRSARPWKRGTDTMAATPAEMDTATVST